MLTPPPPNRPIGEIMWKNIVESRGPQVTVWSMGIACQITKAINTHTHCVILLFHCNSGCTSALPCYVNTYVAAVLFVTSSVCVSFVCLCAATDFFLYM
jgi:hypothetical protein